MNIYIDFILFGLIILVYWIITELFTIFFRFTGLPAERARFQVISLLTGTASPQEKVNCSSRPSAGDIAG